MSTTDAIAIVDNLDPEAIRAAIIDLDNRQSALRVLLRAAVARQRTSNRVNIPQAQGTPAAGKGGANGIRA